MRLYFPKAIAHRRRFVGLDLNPAYIDLARGRTAQVQINMEMSV